MSRVPAPDGTRRNEAPVMVLPPGTELRGLNLQFLAVGGMSVAYKGVARDGRTYFVKEVEGNFAQGVAALQQEARLLACLQHPGIVKLHDHFEAHGYHYLLQDFLTGGDLQRQISPFPDIFLGETQVRQWGLQLCDIFAYLHHQKPPIIYRDLKPKNVLLDGAGKLYLVDFGIARQFKEGQEQDTRLLGSVLTASPEHYGGQTDARSDLYTLGATLHYLLTNGQGERPSPFEFARVREINPDLSQDIEDILARCLERQPQRRFQAAEELRAALAQLPSPLRGSLVNAPFPVASSAVSTETADLQPFQETQDLQPVASAQVGPTRFHPGLLLGLGLGLGLGLSLLFRSNPSPLATPAPSLAGPIDSQRIVATPTAVESREVPLTPISPPTSIALPATPQPVASVTTQPIAKPSPPPIAVATSQPIRPQLPEEPQYVRRTSSPLIASSPSPGTADPTGSQAESILELLGPAWAGLEGWRGQYRSAPELTSIEGPNGCFQLSVPGGYRVMGGPDDYLLVKMGGGAGIRILRIHTLPGVYCEPAQLVACRQRQLGEQIKGSHPIQVGGQNLTRLVIQRPKIRINEVLLAHRSPDWVMQVAAVPGEALKDLNGSFERSP